MAENYKVQVMQPHLQETSQNLLLQACTFFLSFAISK